MAVEEAGSSPFACFGSVRQQQANFGTAVVPFEGYLDEDTARFQTITSQTAYRAYSLEELRVVDYAQGRQHATMKRTASSAFSGEAKSTSQFGIPAFASIEVGKKQKTDNNAFTASPFNANAVADNSSGSGFGPRTTFSFAPSNTTPTFGSSSNSATVPSGQSNNSTAVGFVINSTVQSGAVSTPDDGSLCFKRRSTRQPAGAASIFTGPIVTVHVGDHEFYLHESVCQRSPFLQAQLDEGCKSDAREAQPRALGRRASAPPPGTGPRTSRNADKPVVNLPKSSPTIQAEIQEASKSNTRAYALMRRILATQSRPAYPDDIEEPVVNLPKPTVDARPQVNPVWQARFDYLLGKETQLSQALESRTHTISFHFDEPDAFQLYQQWLYTGFICSQSEGQISRPVIQDGVSNELATQGPAQTRGGPNEWELLLDAYLMAEKMSDISFKDSIMDALLEKHAQSEPEAKKKAASYVGKIAEKLPIQSKCYRFMLTMYVFEGKSDWISAYHPPNNFLNSFATMAMKCRERGISLTDGMPAECCKPCFFHEHAADAPCSKDQQRMGSPQWLSSA